jgi:nucleoside-diphosphate-sugar epimerase
VESTDDHEAACAMKVLVTGSAGFIGFHTAAKLIERGDTVVGIDNVNDYYDPGLKEARLAELDRIAQANRAEYSFIRGDLSDQATVDKCFADHRFDRVIHLAAQAGVRHSIEAPRDYVKSNIDAFTNMLEACRHAETPHLTYASTSSAPYRIFNIGNSSPVPLIDYVRAIEAATNRKAEVRLLPLQPGDVPDTSADVSELVDAVGYKPATPVTESVARFVDWYRRHYGV